MIRIIVFVLTGCWAVAWTVPASAMIILSDVQARFEVVSNGGTTIRLLAGGPFGAGGIAAGSADLDGTGAVSGIEPTPFRWVASLVRGGVDPDPFAPEDARVLRFSFDSAGDFSGVTPDPFRISMVTNGTILGDLNFDGVTDAGLGSLTGITGLTLVTTTGTVQILPFGITAVPEPGSLALFLAGLIGLGLAMRSRRA